MHASLSSRVGISRIGLAAVVALVALTAPASLALAQSEEHSVDTEAHALFEAGRTAFGGGRFADALTYFQRAYDLSHRAALLYNIGQCHDRLRHDAEAVAAFEGFVAAEPGSSQIEEVNSRLEILRAALAAAHPATAATPSTDASDASETQESSAADTATSSSDDARHQEQPTSHADGGPGAAPWVVLAVGGVVAIVGAVLVGVAFADIGTVEGSPQDARFSTVSDAYNQAPILSGVGWAALGVGLATAAIGLGWALAAPSGGSGEHVSLRIGPGGVSLTGAF